MRIQYTSFAASLHCSALQHMRVSRGRSHAALTCEGLLNRADRPTILKISADHVRIQIKSGISSEGANEEILVRAALQPAYCFIMRLCMPTVCWVIIQRKLVVLHTLI